MSNFLISLLQIQNGSRFFFFLLLSCKEEEEEEEENDNIKVLGDLYDCYAYTRW